MRLIAIGCLTLQALSAATARRHAFRLARPPQAASRRVQECKNISADFCATESRLVSTRSFELATTGACSRRCRQPAARDCLSNMEQASRAAAGSSPDRGGEGDPSPNSLVLAILLALVSAAVLITVALIAANRCAHVSGPSTESSCRMQLCMPRKTA